MTKLERTGFTLVLASIVMVIATVAAPGLQRVVAPVACPSGTDASYVVRVPHDPSPTVMVRNSPLVCVDGDTATVASPVRTLGSWFLLGLPIGWGVLRVGRAALRLLAAARREDPLTGPTSRTEQVLNAMAHPPSMVGRSFLVMFATIASLLGGPAVWAWLALDDPYRSYSCTTSDGGRGTCADGELVYQWMGGVSIGVVALTVSLYGAIRIRQARRRSRHRQLVVHGRDGVATLVRAERTNTRINGQGVVKWIYEVDPGDGGPTFEITERAVSSPAQRIGGRLRVRWDPSDRSNLVLLGTPPAEGETPATTPPPPDPPVEQPPVISAG